MKRTQLEKNHSSYVLLTDGGPFPYMYGDIPHLSVSWRVSATLFLYINMEKFQAFINGDSKSIKIFVN